MIYFSVFYLPSYIKGIRHERILNIQNELIESTQELVYNHHEIDISDLETMIKGKELKYDVTYPFSTADLLIQTQERFLENKFIPLQERKELIETIDVIRSKIEKLEPKAAVTKKQDLYANLAATASGIIGTIVALLGFIGLYLNSRKQKEYELAINLEDNKEEIENEIRSSLDFESITRDIIRDILREIIPSYKIQTFSSDTRIDFVLSSDSKKWAIEVKYQSRQVTTQTIRKILSYIGNSNLIPMLITNAPLARMASEEIKTYNSENPDRIFVIINAETPKDLETNLKLYFSSNT